MMTQQEQQAAFEAWITKRGSATLREIINFSRYELDNCSDTDIVDSILASPISDETFRLEG